MNPYQPGVAPIGADYYGRPSQSVVTHLRRAGFWSSFLGWICVLFVLLIVVLVLMAPSTPASSMPTPMPDPLSTQIDPADRQVPAVPSNLALVGGGLLIVTLLSVIASIGMVIMLLWFGGSTKTLQNFPNFDQLHQVCIQQRRLWFCIGIYCLCSIIYFALSATTVMALISQMFARN